MAKAENLLNEGRTGLQSLKRLAEQRRDIQLSFLGKLANLELAPSMDFLVPSLHLLGSSSHDIHPAHQLRSHPSWTQLSLPSLNGTLLTSQEGLTIESYPFDSI